MSAIFGAFLRGEGILRPESIRRMGDRLSHRWVGAPALWREGDLALGQGGVESRFRRSPGAERGAAVRMDGDLVVVADVRLDDRGELLSALRVSDQLEGAATDADLVLAGYRKWGRDLPQRLVGDFAFAVWDSRRRSLFLARDPMGVKPLYYHTSRRLFAFATEIDALLALDQIPDDPDEIQIAFYLDRHVESERTFYRAIHRLPAAHCLMVKEDRESEWRYWSPDPDRALDLPTGEAYAEAFREIFIEAVACRLRGAGTPGASLSGGLDSSSIVCAARRLLPAGQPLHAFSSVYPGLPEEDRRWIDESEYIDAVTSLDGVVGHRIRGDRIGPMLDVDAALSSYGQPPLGYNLYMHQALYGAARNVGVDVFLDGFDGDSVVSHGYERFLDLARNGEWGVATEEIEAQARRHGTSAGFLMRYYLYPHLSRLARSGRWIEWIRASNAVARRFGVSRGGLLLRYGVGAWTPPGSAEGTKGARGEAGAWIRPEFARRVELEERKRERESSSADSVPTARAAHAASLPSPLLQNGLELADAVAASYGIEPRYPFFDRRLIEFCVAVPSAQKLGDGWTRSIHRRGMEGILPPEVQWRVRKGDLSVHFVRAMREIEGDRLKAELLDEPSVLEEYLDMETLGKIQRRFLGGSDGNQGKEDAMKLYQAAVLARWLRNGRTGGSTEGEPAKRQGSLATSGTPR